MKLKCTLLVMLALFFSLTVNATKIPVVPGWGTLDEAVLAAQSGDTLVLTNDSVYVTIDALVIDKQLAIIGSKFTELPGLTNLPVISNDFTAAKVFSLKNKCDLSLIGVDVDAKLGANVFSARSGDKNATISLSINRCRIHNSGKAIMQDAAPADSVYLKKCVITNSFIFRSGEHGIYIKGYWAKGGEEYKFENITFYNLGAQINYVQVILPDLTKSVKYIYNHITAHALSDNLTLNKETFGVSDAVANASMPLGILDVTVKNSIFCKQISTADPGIKLLGLRTDGKKHNVLFKNNDVFKVLTISKTGDAVEEGTLNLDPQFADTAKFDFTVKNAALLGKGDDGKILGAVYWQPDFKDDLADVKGIHTGPSKNTNLQSLKYGDSDVPGFSASKLEYSIELPAGTTSVPALSAVASNKTAKVEVKNAASLTDKSTIIVTAEDGSKQTYTVAFTVKSGPSAIAEIKEAGFECYPNPVNDIINIRMKNNLKNGQLTIYNMIGKKVIARNLNSVENQINLKGFYSGIYLIFIESAKGNFTQRIIKK